MIRLLSFMIDLHCLELATNRCVLTYIDLSQAIILFLFTGAVIKYQSQYSFSISTGDTAAMSPYKKESDMKALVSIRIFDNIAKEEVR